MKKVILIAVIALFFVINSNSQDCEYYFNLEEGTEMIIKNYDQKDKITGWTKQTVKQKESIDEGSAMTITIESYEPKVDTAISKKDLRYECHNGIIFVDMKSYLNDESLAAYQSMDVQVTSENMELPSNMSSGDILGEGKVDVTVYNSGVQMLKMVIFVKNRKVEAEETITTPAGTFDCFKISSEIETTMIFKINTSTIEWYSKEYGVVRSETYDKKGKLVGYSILESFKKP